MATLDYRTTCELNRPVTIKHLDGMFFSQDVQANRIVVSVVRGGVNEDLSGTVSANIIRADGETVVQTGEISGNVASVTMPAAAYAVPGAIAVFVKHTESGVTSTIAAVTGYVYKSTTDTIVDPGTVVPNINELLALIDECESAISIAEDAQAAAESAQDAAEEAQEAAEAARDAAQASAGDFQGITSTVTGLDSDDDPTIEVTHEEGGIYNFAFGIPKGEKGETGDPAPAATVKEAVDDYLEENFSNPSNPPLDRSLTSALSAAPADLVGDLKNEISEFEVTVNEPTANTKEIAPSINFTGRTKTCIIVFDSVSEDATITRIKADIVKSAGATYKFKLVEYLQTTGKGIYTVTKISDEFAFEEPTEDHEVLTLQLGTPFVISAGHGLAVVSKETGLFGHNTDSVTSESNVSIILRDVTYDSLAVDTKLMNQTAVPTPQVKRLSFVVYDSSTTVKDFITREEANALIEDFITEEAATELVNGEIEDSEELMNLKYDRSSFNYIPDKFLYNGEVVDDSTHRWVTLDKYVWLNKGDTIVCGTTERLKVVRYYNDFASYEDVASSVSYFTATTSGYYRWAVDIQRSISGITEPYVNTTNSIIGQVNEYGQKVNDAYNAVAIMQNPFIMSDNTQLMAHCAMMDYDTSDNTIWLVYYANESTTTENNTDVRTYLTIKHINPYLKTVIASTTFKVGDTIGTYTQANTPPYDPTITVLSDYVLVTFWGNENNERCISCFRVDKSTLAISNYAVNKLTYNGTDYDLNCTNLKAIYEAYSGTTISTIDTVAFSCHFPVYNNEYYGVINDIFSASGYKSFLVKSSDLVTWSIVHCFTEIPATNEASICIRNGILYMSDRNNMYVTSYNLTNGTVKYVSVPMVQGCKPCLFNYKNTLGEEKVVLASNIIAKYTASVEGFRRNMGLFVINEDLSIELKSRILTSAGCHYPDLASDGFDLFLLWSEDRRNLNRKVQRSDIGFAKILI